MRLAPSNVGQNRHNFVGQTFAAEGEKEEARELVRKMSETCGLTDYRILETQRELKKAPPTYIIEEER